MANVVLPKVRLFIPCLDVVIQKGKRTTIIGPLHTVRMPAGITDAFAVEELWFYAQLSDGVGRFNLSVQLINDDGIIVGTTAPSPHDFPAGSQLNVKETKIMMAQARLARPGMYEFKLIANHATLEERGTALLRVLSG